MASNLIILIAMASDPIEMASYLIAMASNMNGVFMNTVEYSVFFFFFSFFTGHDLPKPS